MSELPWFAALAGAGGGTTGGGGTGGGTGGGGSTSGGSLVGLVDGLYPRALALGTSVLDLYSQWYEDGSFRNSSTAQWAYTSSGPASLCSNLYRVTGDADYLRICTESFNYMCNNLIDQSTGRFTDEPNSGSSILESFVVTANLGWALVMLGKSIKRSQAFKWINAIKRMYLYADTTGDLLWYPNANWVADKVRGLYMLTKACHMWGDVDGYKYWNGRYNEQVSFFVNPVAFNSRWAGYGYVIDTAGSGDKSNEVAHFSEYGFGVLGAGPPVPNGGAGTSWNGVPPYGSYDTDYTGLTLEHLSQWFVASREYRALQYLNAVTNKYMQNFDLTTWNCTTTGGSRHTIFGGPMFQPSLGLLGLLGQRTTAGAWNSTAQILDQWDKATIRQFAVPTNGDVPIGISRSYSGVIGTVLYACELARPPL